MRRYMTTKQGNPSFTTTLFLAMGVAALGACSALEAELADEALDLPAELEEDEDADAAEEAIGEGEDPDEAEPIDELMADPEAVADWDDECDGCSWILTTPVRTGTGATCGQAIANLHSQQDVEMNMICPDTPLCGTPARTTTVSCHSSGSHMSVSGYAAFRCEWGMEEDVGCY